MTLIRDNDDERLARIEQRVELARRAREAAEAALDHGKEGLAAAQAALEWAATGLNRLPKAHRPTDARRKKTRTTTR